MCEKYARSPSFQFLGRTSLQFSKNPVLVGFRKTDESNPLSIILIFRSKNGIAAVLLSIVNRMLRCCEFSNFKSFLQNSWFSSVAKVPSTYFENDLGCESNCCCSSFDISNFAMKKFALFGPIRYNNLVGVGK